MAGSEIELDLHIGEVKVAHGPKGYSYVSCPDSGYDKDVFIHKSTADANLMVPGDIVAFSIYVNNKGFPEALTPVWRLQSPLKEGQQAELGDYVGKVKPFQASGNTFVECEELSSEYGREPFLHESSTSFLALEPGDTIAFQLHVNAKGLPQVSNPCWKVLMGDWNSSGYAGWNAPVDVSSSTALAVYTGPHTESSDLYIGWVKKVDPGKSYSYIECPDSGFERDVYVRSSAMDPAGMLAEGDTVAFALRVSDKGQPQAVAPLWKLWGHADDGANVKLGDHYGYIARGGPNGAGFVECASVVEDHGKDAYIHGSVMGQCNLEVGDEIMFDVRPNDKGFPQVQKPCWKNCSQEVFSSYTPQSTATSFSNAKVEQGGKGESKAAQSDAGHPTDYIIGWVSAVDQAKECAFINSPDSGFEKAVYAHPNYVNTNLLAVDDCVAFRLHVSPKGLPQASGPLWKMWGSPASNKPAKFGEYVGKVREVPQSSHGTFVECPDVCNQYGKDPFVHNSIIEQCSLVAGDTIVFALHISPKGLPQVSAPCWKSCSAERYTPPLGALSGGQVASAPSAPRVVRPIRGGAKRAWEDTPSLSSQKSAPSQDSAASIMGDLCVGTVSSVEYDRGYSYVNVPDGGFERDVWVHSRAVPPEMLQVGDTLSLSIHFNDRGMPQAKAPVWKLMGRRPASGNILDIGQLIGKVKSVVATGAAYVECPAVKAEHGRDAYVGARLVEHMGIQVDDVVSFTLNIKEPGYPQVSSPCWKCVSDDRFVSLSEPPGNAPAPASEPQPPAGPPPAKVARLSTPALADAPASDAAAPPQDAAAPQDAEEVNASTGASDFFEPGGALSILDPFAEEPSDEKQSTSMPSDAPEGA